MHPITDNQALLGCPLWGAFFFMKKKTSVVSFLNSTYDLQESSSWVNGYPQTKIQQ